MKESPKDTQNDSNGIWDLVALWSMCVRIDENKIGEMTGSHSYQRCLLKSVKRKFLILHNNQVAKGSKHVFSTFLHF